MISKIRKYLFPLLLLGVAMPILAVTKGNHQTQLHTSKNLSEIVQITPVQPKAIQPSRILCISVDENDNVTIVWSEASDPNNEFLNYQISSVTNGVLSTIANLNTTTYTDANAGNAANEYFITTNSSGGSGAVNSDTLSSIFLNLNNPGNGEALLSWNNPSNTQLTGFNDYYHIYQEYPTGNWNLIDSVPYGVTNYRDTIKICDAFLNYRIELPTDECSFKSNIEGDDFEDQIVPDIPVINFVTIDTSTNDVMLSWNVNAQSDTYGYVIYQVDPNGNLVEIDTVYGLSNTSYTHSPNINNGPLEYSIAAFDSCLTNNQPPTFQTSAKAEPHTTNFLTSDLNVCERLLVLNWSGYEGFGAVDSYDVYINRNGSGWNLFATTTSNQSQVQVNFGDELFITVKSNSANNLNASFSNIDTLSFTEAGGPTFSYLSVATVENEKAVVKHRISLDGGVGQVRLERLNTSSGNYEEIDSSPVGTNAEIIFVDETAEIDRRNYTYRTEVIDTCNQSLGYSNIGKTIYLQVETDQLAQKHILSWTPYKEFIGNLYTYEVYRAVNGQFNSTPIATLSPGLRTYTDDVSELEILDDGKICYVITAVEGDNAQGFEEVSYSNEGCGVIKPTIFIPNSFTVGGLNPVFKPETRQRKIENYAFEIYDRYGRMVFETDNPEAGWDGRIEDSDRYAQEGVYIYRLSLRDGNGIEVLTHGHVTLLDYR
jgi:gliding motility-associated-like protein